MEKVIGGQPCLSIQQFAQPSIMPVFFLQKPRAVLSTSSSKKGNVPKYHSLPPPHHASGQKSQPNFSKTQFGQTHIIYCKPFGIHCEFGITVFHKFALRWKHLCTVCTPHLLLPTPLYNIIKRRPLHFSLCYNYSMITNAQLSLRCTNSGN